MKTLHATCVVAGVLFLGASGLRGQVQVGPVWTGGAADNNWSTPGNWLAGAAPATNSDVFFSYALGDLSSTIDSSTTLDSLDVLAPFIYTDYNYGYRYDNYRFGASSPVTLTIGAGGITTNNIFANFSSSISINLAAPQSWYIGDENDDPVQINGTITDNGNALFKGGYGTLVLNGSNNLTGTLTLDTGALTLGNDNALGTATLNADYFAILQSSGNITISNPVTISDELDFNTAGGTMTLTGPITINNGEDYPYIYVYGRNALNLTGSFTLNAPLEIDIDGSNTVTMSGHLVSSEEAQEFTLYDEGTLLLNGTVDPGAVSSYSIYEGKLIFGAAASLPSGGTTIAVYGSDASGYDGYAGLGVTGVTAASFLGAFDKTNSSGTIGFDNGITINDPIDLVEFNSNARLGSATTATLGPAAVITPQGTSYNFGGGGGTLVVESNLTGTDSLSVLSSAYQPLSLELSGTNTFTGGTMIDNSVLRFDSASAFPSTGTFSLQTPGSPDYYSGQAYVGFGYTVDLSTPALSSALGSRFAVPAGSTLVIGFDTPGAGSISTAIDLSGFPVGTFLGTSTSLTVSGPITPAGGGDPYAFAAVKDGHLTIASALSGSGGVLVGLPSTDYFPNPDYYTDQELYNYDYLRELDDGVVNFSDARSTVTLAGDNSALSGTVTLQGGRLEVGNNQALGTGGLEVTGASVLAAAAPGLNIPNAIDTSSDALGLDSTANDFTLSGPITGYGLVKLGTGTVSLTGAVDLSYYLRVEQGTVDVSSANFYADSLYVNPAGTVNFHTASPSVYYLYGDSGGSINLDPGTTLEIESGGYYAGTIAGAGGLSLPDSDLLELDAANSYTGGTYIGYAVLLANANGAVGTGTVQLDSGEFDLGRGVTMTNNLVFTSGTLGGFGTFAPASGPITIGTYQTVSPGLSSSFYYGDYNYVNSEAGALTFASSLTFAAGGSYVWNLVDASNVAGSGWGFVNVNGTLTITSSPGSEFVISLVPSGYADYTTIYNFDPTRPYSWTIATASGGITGFNPANFLLDTSYFASLFVDYPLASFDLTQNGNSLVLNFDPVPEPSTYLLMGVGLGLLGLGRHRRVRRVLATA